MSLVDLGKRLIESAKMGETEDVRLLMTNGAPFTMDWLGNTPLHMTALYGHVETAEVLLRGGISRDAKTKVDRTPLHIAAQEGHLELVRLLLNHCADVDARDMLKMTPLHWAVEHNHIEVVKLLLERNANFYARSKFDKTPLDIAVDNKYEAMIDILTKHALAENDKKQNPKARVGKANQAIVHSTPKTTKSNVPLLLGRISSENLSPVSTRSLRQSTVSSSCSTSSGTSPKPQGVSKRLLLRANVANIQKTATVASIASSIQAPSSDSEDCESGDQSSNVLAALAALAEATSSNAGVSSTDAVQWLEMNGITMLPTDNSSIITSALEGGQTVSLTEAGKLALTWAKEQQNLNTSSSTVSSTTQERKDLQSKKMITIVADPAQISSLFSSQQTPMVVVGNPASVKGPPTKKLKIEDNETENMELISAIENMNGSSCTISSEEDERLKLKEELAQMKREAELYKAQLMQKEHEAEQYKQQLEKIKCETFQSAVE